MINNRDLLVGSIVQVVHDDCELDLLVWILIQRLIIVGHQAPIIKVVELIQYCCVWF